MKRIVIKNQEEFDKIRRIEKDEEVIFESNKIKVNCILEVFGQLILRGEIDCSWSESRYIVARENSSPSIEAWGNSSPSIVAWGNSSPSIVAWGNSSPSIEAWENSSPSIEARENSSPSIEARENSSPSIVAWGNSSPSIVARENSSPSIVARENSSPSIVARENSSPSIVARENSSPSIEARENSSPSIEAWGNSSPSIVAWGGAIRLLSEIIKPIILHGFSVLFTSINFKLKIKKDKTSIVQKIKPQRYLAREGIEGKDSKVILYKKVSKDFKTQEGTKNETLWTTGSIVTHPSWSPKNSECGEGKFHACSRPYFCDEFRNEKGDRYIAVQIKTKDLYEWENNPQYPHKIGFREGKVLYEVDRLGRKLSNENV